MLSTVKKYFWAFPRDGTGKCSRLSTTGWEWDGNVGSHLFDGMGRDYTTSWWNETGRETIPGRTSVGMPVGYIFGESVGNIVGNAVVLPNIICLDLYSVQPHAATRPSCFCCSKHRPLPPLWSTTVSKRMYRNWGCFVWFCLRRRSRAAGTILLRSLPCLPCLVCAHGVCTLLCFFFALYFYKNLRAVAKTRCTLLEYGQSKVQGRNESQTSTTEAE